MSVADDISSVVGLVDNLFVDLRRAVAELDGMPELLDSSERIASRPGRAVRTHALYQLLISIASRDGPSGRLIASHIRKATDLAFEACESPLCGAALELALHSFALQFHDSPAQRIRCVGVAMARFVEQGLVVPTSSGTSDTAVEKVSIRQWILNHIAVARELTLRAARQPLNRFANWTDEDLEAGVIAIQLHCSLAQAGPEEGQESTPDRRKGAAEYRTAIPPNWAQAIRATLRHLARTDSDRGLQFRVAAIQKIDVLALSPGPRETRSIERAVGPTLVVCRQPIVASFDRAEKEEIERHRVLESPLPLATMPKPSQIANIHIRLADGFLGPATRCK